jgi:hypothetical protein
MMKSLYILVGVVVVITSVSLVFLLLDEPPQRHCKDCGRIHITFVDCPVCSGRTSIRPLAEVDASQRELNLAVMSDDGPYAFLQEGASFCTNCLYFSTGHSGDWRFSSLGTNDFALPLPGSISQFPLPAELIEQKMAVYAQTIFTNRVIDRVQFWFQEDDEYERLAEATCLEQGLEIEIRRYDYNDKAYARITLERRW